MCLVRREIKHFMPLFLVLCMNVCMYVCMSVCRSVYLSLCLSLYLSLCLSIGVRVTSSCGPPSCCTSPGCCASIAHRRVGRHFVFQDTNARAHRARIVSSSTICIARHGQRWSPVAQHVSHAMASAGLQ